MAKKSENGLKEYTLSEMLPQIGLTNQEKFVCLRVFQQSEKHTLADWEKLLRIKKIR